MTALTHPDVLVVDDNEDARYATIRVLERVGLAVVGAGDGTTAWELVSTVPPRLVLLDVVLPDESGFEVLRRIRSRSELDDTSVVMLSSMRTSIPDRTNGLNAGADGYIIRPIDNDELVARVRAQLRKHELVGRLRRSEQRYRDMIHSQADGVLIVDRSGMVRYANPSADRLFAVEQGGLVEHPFGIPIRGGHQGVILRRVDGTTLAVEMSVVDTEWDDAPVWLIALRDISERQRLEEQVRLSQRLESVGQLTGGIAHDFNNLLAVILGAGSELVQRTDGDLADLSRMIVEAAQRGADFVARLLAFSSRQFLEPARLDVRDLVREMLPVLRRSLGDTVDVELVDDGTDDWALIDRAGLEGALLNLCLNGRDAMRSGGKLVVGIVRHVEAVDGRPEPGRPEPGEYVALSVTDRGEGISPEHLERVLEPFFTTKPPGLGTGLGLPMVYGFVRQSGGFLDIDSEPGRGTTVTMLLPAVQGPSGGPPSSPARPPALADPGEPDAATRGVPNEVDRSTVLVLDDDELLLTLVVLQVERLGHHVIGTSNVEDARRVLAEQHVDVLLSDIQLGGEVGGNDFASEALRAQPALAVVLMSGLALDARHPSGHEVAVLGKPFTRAELAEALERAIGR